MIEAYFSGTAAHDYHLSFVWEPDFFGTAGSLRLIKDHVSGTFVVSNCDIIVKANYAEVIRFHRDNGASLTAISSIQHHCVPYGVIEFKNGGEITRIKEKPEFTFAINTGVYVLEPECLDFIDEGQYCDMPTLIEKLMTAGRKVLTYPVNENDYIDIGQWEEYRAAVDKLAPRDVRGG